MQVLAVYPLIGLMTKYINRTSLMHVVALLVCVSECAMIGSVGEGGCSRVDMCDDAWGCVGMIVGVLPISA